MRARPLGAKVFLEGIEVPLIGATITSQMGSASIAYVDVVPQASINHVKPRTHVLIAIRDSHDKAGQYPYVKAWEGEVFGYSFNKTAQSRSMTLSCIDFTSYWDNVLTYYFNPTQSMGQGSMALAPIGMDIEEAKRQGIPVVSVPSSTATYFRTKLEESLKTGDLLDGLVELIKSISKTNSFYKAAESRLKISKRIELKSSKAIEELIKQKEALDWFLGLVNGRTGLNSMRHTILELMSIVFHDQVAIPFPSAVYNKDGSISKSLEYIFKPNLFMVSPPSCNIFFPDEYSSFSFSRNFFVEPTRLIYRPEMPTKFGDNVVLPASFSPENYQRYMQGNKEYSKTGDFGVDDNPGNYGDPMSGDDYKDVSPYKREQHFLTNEEKFKGILMAQEGLVPATDEFRASLGQDQRNNFSRKIAQYMLIKKRFQTRELNITSHLKPSVVPGFPALILDDSPAGQSMIAYVSSVTHRIYATEGGYTNVSLSFARTVTEQENSSEAKEDPLIPPWFSETIFGTTGPVSATQNTAGTLGEPTVPKGRESKGGAGLADYYKSLLGNKGSKPVTDSVDGKGMCAAVAALLDSYRARKGGGGEDVLDYISAVTDRDYVSVPEAFKFIGATMSTPRLQDTEFTQANNGAFSPDAEDDNGDTPLDRNQRSARRQVVRRYRDKLKEGRGFRG